jgi:hypothetical protein
MFEEETFTGPRFLAGTLQNLTNWSARSTNVWIRSGIHVLGTTTAALTYRRQTRDRPLAPLLVCRSSAYTYPSRILETRGNELSDRLNDTMQDKLWNLDQLVMARKLHMFKCSIYTPHDELCEFLRSTRQVSIVKMGIMINKEKVRKHVWLSIPFPTFFDTQHIQKIGLITYLPWENDDMFCSGQQNPAHASQVHGYDKHNMKTTKWTNCNKCLHNIFFKTLPNPYGVFFLLSQHDSVTKQFTVVEGLSHVFFLVIYQ